MVRQYIKRIIERDQFSLNSKMKAIILLAVVAVASAASPFQRNTSLPPLVHPKDDTSAIGRVVGGADAAEGQFPYQCSLYVNNGFTCGCVILGERYVLTAAHCVGGPVGSYLARVGSNQINQGTEVRFSDIVPHESYGNFMNDICLMRTTAAIQFNDRVAVIERHTNFQGATTECQLSGWGRTSNGGALPTNLKVVNSQIQTPQSCGDRTGIRHPGEQK